MTNNSTAGQALSARDVMELGPVIPVVVIDDAGLAVELAQSLLLGGVRTMEITLRTPAALAAIARVAAEVPEMVVGAGTVLGPADVEAALSAGSRFLVSPGSTPELLDAVAESEAALLPGAVTASEVMALRARGYTQMKFFPAATSGGLAAIKALSGPFPDVTFCPTGGIGPDDAADYLALPTVACVGGSWLTPASALAGRDWAAVERTAAHAARLRG